jgi:archaellum biogenesis ATPase FlaH
MENNQRFIEYVENSISNRNQIIPIDLYHSAVKNTSFVDKESYGSYYRFDNSLFEYVNKISSVKGYEGLVYVDRLILDIDKKTSDDNSLYEQVKAYIGMCLDFGIKSEDINLWYSGSGFHIELLDVFGFQPSKNVHEKVKQTLTKHFNFADSIYDKTRIIRSNWSFNLKTNKYKVYIPLKYLEDISIGEIQKAASSKEEYQSFSEEYNEWYGELNEPYKTIEPYLQANIIDAPVTINKAINKTSKTNSVVTCMQHVFNETALEGSRHQKSLRLASSYKRAGLPFLAAVASILEWNNNSLSANNITRIVQNVYEGNYQYGCNDIVMSEYCDSKCIYYKNKNYTLDIKGIEELEDSFREYIQNDFSKKSIDMAEIFEGVPSYQMKPGELIIFSGDTGMGKTAFVQNIVAKAKKDTLFLSLEMNEYLTFRRFVQIVAHKTKDWVNNMYLSNENASFKELLHNIKIMTIQPQLDAVKRIVAEHEPAVLVVDTTDELQIEGFRNDIQEQNMKIDALKSIAQKHNTVVLAIHHINKSSAMAGNLGVHSLKGSSNVVQKADKVIMIKGANRDDKLRTISSVKSRDEAPFEMIAEFNYETMTYKKVELK